MLQQSTLEFLSKLTKNNNKPWFDKNKAAFLAAKEDVEEFVTVLKKAMAASIEPALANQDTKDMIFRIYKDVRFSKDKTPYKDHFGVYLSKGGKKSPLAGYYLHIQPKKSFIAAGLWQPENDLLKSVRQEIDYNFKEFKKILDAPSFKKLFKKMEGEQLKTNPKGYDADNPAIEYLKMKSFVVTTQVTDKELTSKNAVTAVTKLFATGKPLVTFLNRAMD
jgi:uncharacterized protein (TIGR02453 family)